jgi:hypothetical protein
MLEFLTYEGFWFVALLVLGYAACVVAFALTTPMDRDYDDEQ